MEASVRAGLRCTPGYRWTELHSAAKEGSLQRVQSLVQEGANIDEPTTGKKTPLILACSGAHRDVVNFLISAGADINFCPLDQVGVLHYASLNGWLDIVKMFVDNGNDVDAKTGVGHTPLLLAAQNRHKLIVQLLINAGANIRCFDSGKGFFNYHIWCESKSSILFNGGGYSGADTLTNPFHSAYLYITYTTLLHLACELGWLEVVQCLLKKGADINEMSFSDCTPLHIAIKYKKIEIIECLINEGANPNKEDLFSRSSFSNLIKMSPDAKLVKLFIESNAYFNGDDLNQILADPAMKEHILKDVDICTQAIINKFNYRDLPEVYKRNESCKYLSLPVIDKIRILNDSHIINEVMRYVKQEIESKGYCDVFEGCPNVLKMMSIKSFLIYFESIEPQDEVSKLLKRVAEFEGLQPSNKVMRF